jgi:hypothetical protein
LKAKLEGAGRLVSSSTTLDPNGSSFDLINVGGAAVDWKAYDNNGMLDFNPAEGTIAVGKSIVVTLVKYFPNYDIYKVNTDVEIRWADGTLPLPMRGRYDVGPGIEFPTGPPHALCPGNQGYASVEIADLDEIASVTMQWTAFDTYRAKLASASLPMTKLSGNERVGKYQGLIGPLPTADPGSSGLVTWKVTAVDGHGHVSELDPQLIEMQQTCR